jgi:hypothetical protein
MVIDKNGWVRVPRVFMDDHADRGLDTPEIKKVAARHYWIAGDDSSIPELLDDAVYYATDVDACERGLVASARATIAALKN